MEEALEAEGNPRAQTTGAEEKVEEEQPKVDEMDEDEMIRMTEEYLRQNPEEEDADETGAVGQNKRDNGQEGGASRNKRRKKEEKREAERSTRDERAEKRSRKDAADPDESVMKLRKKIEDADEIIKKQNAQLQTMYQKWIRRLKETRPRKRSDGRKQLP